MRRATIFSWLIAPLLILVMALAALNQRAIYDWWFLRNYTPSGEVASLSLQSHLSTEGQKYFYVSDPQVQEKTEFKQNCTFSEFNIVVGCYNGRNIYILNIDNQEISEGEIVTAAHEMLHAAFDRLSSPEKDRIGQLVLRDAQAVNDPDVLNTMSLYKESVSDKEYINELHSILGTEVYNLSDELEQYYGQYFEDRQALVDIAQAYDEVFSKLEDQVDKLADRLNKLVVKINLTGAQLESRFSQLESERAALQAQIDSGVNTSALRQAIAAFESKVDQYNEDVSDYKADIDAYEKLRLEYEDLVVHHEELVRSIDSSYVPMEIAE